MRILHTSDLHLGRTLYGAQREATFEKFLDWLLTTIHDEGVECLLIAGDVFDNATPSHRMQSAYYRFLAAVATGSACRHVVVTGGNHDSPTLLDAPDTLLEALNIRVVGQASREAANEVFLLKDKVGTPEAVVAAVPYLRERDLRASIANETQTDKEARLAQATAEHYRACTERALALRGDACIPYIALGHLFAADCEVGGEERSLYVGSLGLIPAAAFPPEIDYLALGHLHKAQKLGGCETRRYCGSPIALDFSEKDAAKSVCLIDTQGRNCRVETLPVPAFDTLVSLTGDEATVRSQLAELVARREPVLCEVRHTEGTFAPALAAACRDLVQDSDVTLVRVVSQTVAAAQLSHDDVVDEVDSIAPEAMFDLLLQKKEKAGQTFDEAQKAQLKLAYAEILESVFNPGEAQ